MIFSKIWKQKIENYYFFFLGILTHPGTDVIGIFHTEGGLQPDIQIMALPAGLSTDAGVVLAPAMGISQEVVWFLFLFRCNY